MKSKLRNLFALIAFQLFALGFATEARAQWYTETIEVTASVWNLVMLAGLGGGGGGGPAEGGLVSTADPDSNAVYVELHTAYTITCSSPYSNVGRFSTSAERYAVMQYINATIPLGYRVYQSVMSSPAIVTFQDGSSEAFIPGISADSPTRIEDSFREPLFPNPPCAA